MDLGVKSGFSRFLCISNQKTPKLIFIKSALIICFIIFIVFIYFSIPNKSKFIGYDFDVFIFKRSIFINRTNYLSALLNINIFISDNKKPKTQILRSRI